MELRTLNTERPPFLVRTNCAAIGVAPQIDRGLFSVSLALLGTIPHAHSHALAAWPPEGRYEFSSWAGPKLAVHFTIPAQSNEHASVVIVMPGAKRNAKQYHDEWKQVAVANGFITLVVEASRERFPSEYEYNLGGVINAAGELQPEETWLLSAIDLIFFADFKSRFGFKQDNYSLYGHSAGGGFAHLFPLFKPSSKAARIVACNPAFFTMPNRDHDFPFAMRDAPLPKAALGAWFNQRLVILLGDRDLGPRTYPLSNGPQANRQGPHGFARGLGFYHACLCEAFDRNMPLRWQIDIVHGVGHSNADMASHAVAYLLGQ